MEGELMLEKIRQDQIEAEKRLIEKAKEQRKRAAEIEKFNKIYETHKYVRMQQELEEDKKIVAYNKKKDYEAMQEFKRQEREKKQRAIECERLRAKQERYQDQQAQADERRAQEYQRQLEKKDRLDEINRQKAHEKLMKQVMSERELQKSYKAKVAQERAIDEEKERQRIIKEQKIQMERDRKEQEKKRQMNEYFGNELKKQYYQVEDNKKQAELQRLKDAEQEERARQIQYLRERKLIEKQLREHIAAGYEPPPIRSGVVADVLKEILNEKPNSQKA